ncbi:MAG: ABC transporter permease [Acidobacteriia bacterium]|nr:ABC transporter permease [Terriglobia bacterium]
MDFSAVSTIASLEAKTNIRNKWTLLLAVAFGILSLAISYFGLVTAGTVGFQGFMRTAASLLNLVLYLIPIVSLSMATLSLTGEKGASELLFSQPVGRIEILLGKLLGLFLSIWTATLFGFGLAGVIIAIKAGTSGLTRYLGFVALAQLLALVFLSLGALVATLAETRAKASGMSLFLWFFFVLFYDLLVMGISFVLREKMANQFIFVSLFGNPVDMVRVSGLMLVGDVSIFGAAGAALMKFLGGQIISNLLLIAALLLWASVPFLVAGRWLRRRDL